MPKQAEGQISRFESWSFHAVAKLLLEAMILIYLEQRVKKRKLWHEVSKEIQNYSTTNI